MKQTMINSIQHETIVDMLLNSLAAERHVRGPLLSSLLDELSGTDGLAPAGDVGRLLLLQIEAGPVSQEYYERKIAELRKLVHLTRFAARPSGETPLSLGTSRSRR